MKKALIAATLGAASLFGSMTQAQSLPQKFDEPVTVVVPYAPGGASDRAARIVGDALQARFGATVIVENRTGAGGRIAAQYVKNADPAKNTLLIGNPAIMVVAPMVYQDLAYDAVKDFAPVAMATKYGFGIAVSGDSSIKSLDDLVAWAKANPNEFNVAVPATGSLPHFFGLMLADKIGVRAEVIGYRGSAPAITDLIGGMVPVAIDTLDALTEQHNAGRIRIIATSGKERETSLPKVPTFSEQGVELVSAGWNTLFAPAGTPADKVALLGDMVKAVVSDPKVQETLLGGNLIPMPANTAETVKAIQEFRAQWEPVVKASNYVVTK